MADGEPPRPWKRGDPITAARLNQIQGGGRVRAVYPLLAVEGPDGSTVLRMDRIKSSGGSSAQFFVKITAFVSGQPGRYTGQLLTETANTAASGTIAEADIGTFSTEVTVWHTTEIIYQPAQHLLAVGSIVLGKLLGTDSSGRSIIAVDTLPRDVPFAVKVEKDGGSDGNATAAASYTYTVRTMAWNGTTGGATLASAKTVDFPRGIGKVTFPPGSTHVATAVYDGSTLKLIAVPEYATRGTC